MRAVERASRTVKDAVAAGRYAPSTRLTEQEVAAAAGVSRTPVREALRRLHAEGVVDFTPHQGAIVTTWSDEDIEEIFELRAMLEPHVAARAAERASPQQLDELRTLAERQQAEVWRGADGDLECIADLNSRFHRCLQEAAASMRLARALAALLEAPLMMRTFRRYTREDLERSAAHHLEIVRALEVRDAAWAASVMQSHVLAARRTLPHGAMRLAAEPLESPYSPAAARLPAAPRTVESGRPAVASKPRDTKESR
jgi:DNA-binding GntR family transcriptional regulator